MDIFKMSELDDYSIADKEIVSNLFDSDIEYIDHKNFETNAGAILSTTIPDVNPDWYMVHVNQFTNTSTYDSYVLSPEEEKNLFLLYNLCKKRINSLKTKPLTKVTFDQLLFFYEKKERAKAVIVHSNLAFVITMSRKFLKQIDRDELISRGNMTLLNCIEKFDVQKGFKFSTYLARGLYTAFSREHNKKNKDLSIFPVNFDTELQKGDIIDDKREDATTSSIDILRSIISSNKANLNDDELFVIKKRHLEIDGKKPTLEKVGKLMSPPKNKSNLNRIEKNALAKLRKVMQKYMK